jgi:hypothetical protein
VPLVEVVTRERQVGQLGGRVRATARTGHIPKAHQRCCGFDISPLGQQPGQPLSSASIATVGPGSECVRVTLLHQQIEEPLRRIRVASFCPDLQPRNITPPDK